MLEELVRDVVYALRVLRKDLGFTAVAVLTVALGVGANTTVFSVVEAILSFPFPIDRPDRVTLVYGENPSRNLRREGTSADDFLDWREQARSFEHLTAVRPGAVNAAGKGEPVRIAAARVSDGFFPVLGSPIALGRAFLPEEAEPGGDRVAVLTHGFWQSQWGGSPDALGQTIVLDGVGHTIVGVTAVDFFFPGRDTALWTPLVLPRGRTSRDDRSLFVIGRLREGISAEEATVEISAIAGRLEEAFRDTNSGWTARVVTFRDDLSSSTRFATVVLYGSITLVLLIACANVANLLLSRATVREKEIALRSALGAGRLRVIRQLLTESVVLSLLGGALGLLLGIWGMGVLRRMLAPDPRIGFVADQMELNVRVFGHAIIVSVGTGVLFGLVPAFSGSKPNLDETLKEGGRGGSGGRRRHYLRGGLVVSQFAMALALLAAAGALLWSFNHIYSANPGFNPKNLLTFRISLPEATYAEPRRAADFAADALSRLAQIPGAKAVATTSALPMTLSPVTRTARAFVEGSEDPAEDASLTLIHSSVSPGYFETMEIPVVSGRALADRDDEDSQAVAVVSKAMVNRYWREPNPIGKRFKLRAPGFESAWLTVVGVTPDVQTTWHSLRYTGAPIPHVYLPQAQSPARDLAIAIRTSLDPESLAPPVRAALADLDRNLPLADVTTLDAVIARIDTQNRFFVRVLTGLAFIALALAGVGIYGVISYSVAQRTREIGIRMALGAEARDVLAVVLREGAVLAGLGFVVGIGAAVAIVRALASELAGMGAAGAAGPLTFTVVSVVLLGVAQVASYVPARRAVRVDPVAALRLE